MIRAVYEVTYNERIGYAETYEEAIDMERTFKLSYGGGQLCSSKNCAKEVIRL